jgi:hypothetical protein
MLESLLSRGYFPEELPPPFETSSYAAYVRKHGVACFDISKPKYNSSKLAHFNLARAGSLRRELGIPNPVHYSLLADGIVRHWRTISKRFKSPLSLTTPKHSSSGRALSRMSDLDDLPEQRARVRACGKFILQADVARFYPSVYTHSIPWVLHGKATAKKKKFDPSMVGNELDLLLRNCQDQQTMGIPVGPDTSLVIAELILSHVDRALTKKSITGIRYVDDFELVFATEDLALRARTALQGCLGEMELNLGPAKTRIARLPLALRDPWVAELRKFPLNVYRVNHRKLLLAFFDKAFELSTQYPDKRCVEIHGRLHFQTQT